MTFNSPLLKEGETACWGGELPSVGETVVYRYAPGVLGMVGEVVYTSETMINVRVLRVQKGCMFMVGDTAATRRAEFGRVYARVIKA